MSDMNSVMPVPPGSAHWDGDQVLFELQERDRRILCSVSRQALEAVVPGRRARRWQLLEAFERIRPRIEEMARDRFYAAPQTTGVIEIVTAELDAELDDDPEPAAPAAALRRRVGEF